MLSSLSFRISISAKVMLIALLLMAMYFLTPKALEVENIFFVSFVSAVIFAALGFGNLKSANSSKEKILSTVCIAVAVVMAIVFISTYKHMAS